MGVQVGVSGVIGPLLEGFGLQENPMDGIRNAVEQYMPKIQESLQNQDLQRAHLDYNELAAKVAPYIGKSPQADWYVNQVLGVNGLLGALNKGDTGLVTLINDMRARYGERGEQEFNPLARAAGVPKVPPAGEPPPESAQQVQQWTSPPPSPQQVGTTATGQKLFQIPPPGIPKTFAEARELLQQDLGQGRITAAQVPALLTQYQQLFQQEGGEKKPSSEVEKGPYKVTYRQDAKGNLLRTYTPMSEKEMSVSDLDPEKGTNFLPGYTREEKRKAAGLQSSVVMPGTDRQVLGDKKGLVQSLQNLITTLPQTSFGQPGIFPMLEGKILASDYTPTPLADKIITKFGTAQDRQFYTLFTSLLARLRQFSGDNRFSNYDAKQVLKALGNLGRDPTILHELLYHQYARLATVYNDDVADLSQSYDTSRFPPFDTEKIPPVYPGPTPLSKKQGGAPPLPAQYQSLEDQLRKEYGTGQ